eukprot:9964673-Lingulodinium_polyedra.AAC.1
MRCVRSVGGETSKDAHVCDPAAFVLAGPTRREDKPHRSLILCSGPEAPEVPGNGLALWQR